MPGCGPKKDPPTPQKKKIQPTLQKYKVSILQLYTNTRDNLEEMDKFVEMHNLLRLNQKETENMSRPIASNETQSVIFKLSNQSPGPEASFTCEFHQTFREELTPIHLKLFPKLQKKGTFSNSIL